MDLISNKGKLDELENNSGNLKNSVGCFVKPQAFDFENQSQKLKNKYRAQRFRTIAIIAVIVFVLLLVIYKIF